MPERPAGTGCGGHRIRIKHRGDRLNPVDQVLGCAPRYSSLDALREALTCLVAHGQADVRCQQLPLCDHPVNISPALRPRHS